MAGHSMHRFMEFQNGRNEFDGLHRLDLIQPMLFHPLEQVDEPLTNDVIANDD